MTDQNPKTPIPVVNQGAQDVVDIIENLTQVGEDAAEAAIIAEVPVMGTPVLKQVWEAIFDWIVKFIMKPVASLGGRVLISAEEYLALRKAASAQVALDQAKKTGDSNAISKASSEVDQAVASVVHYVGATHT